MTVSATADPDLAAVAGRGRSVATAGGIAWPRRAL